MAVGGGRFDNNDETEGFRNDDGWVRRRYQEKFEPHAVRKGVTSFHVSVLDASFSRPKELERPARFLTPNHEEDTNTGFLLVGCIALAFTP